MPLNGAGLASKPAGTTAVSNTTIESSKFNSVIDDIYAIFNTARPIAYGGTGAATASAARTALGFGTKGADIASAATITLTDNYHHVTGTTTITDIDFADAVDGRWAWLIFDGALTLTHNATSLKLPGGANITTAAGDRGLFVQDNSNNVICLAYVPAAPVVNTLNGQYKFPATQNASSDANTLDDYEEGTFTVTADFATPGTSSWSYTVQDGSCTKIGNMVSENYSLSATPTIGTGSGTVSLRGNPFTHAGASPQGVVGALGTTWTWPASRTMVTAALGASSCQLNATGTGLGATLFAASNMTSGAAHIVRVSVSLQVS